MLVFAVFVALFSSFIVKEREKVKLSHASKDEIAIVEDNDSFLSHTPWIIIIFAVVQLVKELIQMFWLRLSYFKDLTNLFELIMFAFVWMFTLSSISESFSLTAEVRWSVGVLGLFMSYISLTLYFRRFGGLGLYVTMYVEVLFTFVKVISTFMIALHRYFCSRSFSLHEREGDWCSFDNVIEVQSHTMHYMWSKQTILKNRHQLLKQNQTIQINIGRIFYFLHSTSCIGSSFIEITFKI